MPNHADLERRCLALVEALSQELAWTLSAGQQRDYVASVCAFAPPDSSEDGLRRRLQNYHLDHDLVRSLQDRLHPRHDSAWREWCISALRIVWQTGMVAPDAALTGPDDLAQSALEELLRSLPDYAYRSRFSTWAYTIIVRAVQRSHVHLRAAKRSAPTQPIDAELIDRGPPTRESEHPETIAAGNELAALIDTLLATSKNERLARIFKLWAAGDWRLADIARSVGIDSSRVSVLLKEARAILGRDPAIRAWYAADLDTDSSEAQ